MTDTVDPKSFRQGDRVWVEGYLEQQDGYGRWTFLIPDGRATFINGSAVVKHFPATRPIEVGEPAKFRHSDLVVTVLAIAEGQAMLRYPNGVYECRDVECLERLPS